VAAENEALAGPNRSARAEEAEQRTPSRSPTHRTAQLSTTPATERSAVGSTAEPSDSKAQPLESETTSIIRHSRLFTLTVAESNRKDLRSMLLANIHRLHVPSWWPSGAERMDGSSKNFIMESTRYLTRMLDVSNIIELLVGGRFRLTSPIRAASVAFQSWYGCLLCFQSQITSGIATATRQRGLCADRFAWVFPLLRRSAASNRSL